MSAITTIGRCSCNETGCWLGSVRERAGGVERIEWWRCPACGRIWEVVWPGGHQEEVEP